MHSQNTQTKLTLVRHIPGLNFGCHAGCFGTLIQVVQNLRFRLTWQVYATNLPPVEQPNCPGTSTHFKTQDIRFRLATLGIFGMYSDGPLKPGGSTGFSIAASRLHSIRTSVKERPHSWNDIGHGRRHGSSLCELTD